MGAPAVIPRTKRHDRSGLTLAERNAIILYSKGAKEAAARALGWNNQNTAQLGPADLFVRRRLEEIRDQVNKRHGRFRLRGAMMRTEEPPDRLDEREAEPAPPKGDKLDERIEEVPPTPPTPPVREDEPDDAA
jgi:hypothetical protein